MPRERGGALAQARPAAAVVVSALLAHALALAGSAGTAVASAQEPSGAVDGRTVWRKVSTWKAVHEVCSDTTGGVADCDIKRDYLAHLADPRPATCTSGFAWVPIVRGVGEQGQLVQFQSLRDYVQWRMDLEKRTWTDREEWRLFLRGQSEDSQDATGLGRGGVLRDATRCAIPEHYNVSRSLLHEVSAANEEEERMEQRRDQAANDLEEASQVSDPDNPLPPELRAAYSQDEEEPVEEDEARGAPATAAAGAKGTRARASSDPRVGRGRGRGRGRGAAPGRLKAPQRLRGGGAGGAGERGMGAWCLGGSDQGLVGGMAWGGRGVLRLRGGLTLLTHNLLASPLPGLNESQVCV